MLAEIELVGWVGEGGEDKDRGDHGRDTMADYPGGPSHPATAACGIFLLLDRQEGHPEAVDRRSGQREQSRHQSECGEHCEQHCDGRGVAHCGEDRDVHHREAEKGQDHGRARKDDRSSRRRSSPSGCLARVHSKSDLLSVPADHEERVVDPDPECDHGRESRPDGWDVDHVAQQVDPGYPGEEPDQGRDHRHAHGDQGAEGEQEDHDRCGDPNRHAQVDAGNGDRVADVSAESSLEAGLASR